MLNHIVKAAAGTVSHNNLFDAMFGVERPDFLGMCPESYISGQFADMSKIVDIKAFKKEAATGFSNMGLEDDIKDNIVEAIQDAKTSTEVARVIYGVGVYLMTEVIETQPELKEALTKRWVSEGLDDMAKSDGFYTDEAEEAMKSLCRSVLEGKDNLVVEEPVKAKPEPVKAEATTESGITIEPVEPAKAQQPAAKKGNKGAQHN